MYGVCRTAVFLCVSLLTPCNVSAWEKSLAPTLPSVAPFSFLTIDTTERSATLQYNLSKNAVIAPYVGLGEEDNEDISPNERFWQEHSYQSTTKRYDGQQRWAGFKIRMHDMLRLGIDTTTHKITSTVSLAPKTDVKLRGSLKEIRAELRYRF